LKAHDTREPTSNEIVLKALIGGEDVNEKQLYK